CARDNGIRQYFEFW
nr:immunoglobulin heavy chain junction region [Macaca mulatta]MOV37775.1 immunoglobulin heavy chain junction region [Macaca mulatta]MOV37782.1 immunoglobulin heavy chain junction region [Macaca mulatta]MOV37803.1 immunoglobulin heavy chain junction region [Macaca mulatta]MOV37812.1 immunoglobulin heavy chain junction region [Macaca mulatta]